MSHDHDEQKQRARRTLIRVRSDALAKEAYARFQVSYEAEHGLRLAGWAALDEGTQVRWREMLAPVAEQLLQAEDNERDARLLEEEHRELRTRADRDAARLAELEALVARVSQRLPEAALLSKLPAPLLEALASLSSTAAPVVDQATRATVDGAASPMKAEVPAVGAGAEPPAPAVDRPAQAVADGASSPVGAGPPATAGVDSPGAVTTSQKRFAGLSPEVIAELEAAASAFAAEAASIKLPLASETGTQRARARVRANVSQMLIALHKKARDHLLEILGAMLTEDQRATLWPLPDDVFSVAYDVTAILETINVARAFAVFEVPPPGDDARSPKAWARVERVQEQLTVAGLADLHEYTDAQLGQVGHIVAEVLDLDVDPAAQVALGNAGIHFTRALASVRRTTG